MIFTDNLKKTDLFDPCIIKEEGLKVSYFLIRIPCYTILQSSELILHSAVQCSGTVHYGLSSVEQW